VVDLIQNHDYEKLLVLLEKNPFLNLDWMEDMYMTFVQYFIDKGNKISEVEFKLLKLLIQHGCRAMYPRSGTYINEEVANQIMAVNSYEEFKKSIYSSSAAVGIQWKMHTEENGGNYDVRDEDKLYCYCCDKSHTLSDEKWEKRKCHHCGKSTLCSHVIFDKYMQHVVWGADLDNKSLQYYCKGCWSHHLTEKIKCHHCGKSTDRSYRMIFDKTMKHVVWGAERDNWSMRYYCKGCWPRKTKPKPKKKS